MEVSTIGLDIAKQAFQAHGADASGRIVFRRKIVRAKLIEFFSSQPRCGVALEACVGAHHWGRPLAARSSSRATTSVSQYPSSSSKVSTKPGQLRSPGG
jgi:transposase